jgi:hypothetical protein
MQAIMLLDKALANPTPEAQIQKSFCAVFFKKRLLHDQLVFSSKAIMDRHVTS